MLLEQPLAEGEAGLLNGPRHVPADVPVIPRLVDVTRHLPLPCRITHDETVLPRVVTHPGSFGRFRPVFEIPRGRTAGTAEVDDRAQLMLGMARPGTRGQRSLVTFKLNPVGERVLLVSVRTVGTLHCE